MSTPRGYLEYIRDAQYIGGGGGGGGGYHDSCGGAS